MDKLTNRIRYFAIGLLFGTMIVYFMFGNRGCAWLPENRVKNMIGEKEIIVGDSILDVMNCMELTNDDMYALLKDEGEVEFSESITDSIPKVYYIEAEKDENLYWSKFALYEDKGLAEIVEVYRDGKEACTSQKSNQYTSTLPLPHKDVIAIIESHEFRILDQAQCEMEHYGLTEDALFKFHKSATIDIQSSQPRLSPNPDYVMIGEIDGKPYTIKYIIGENRTRISFIRGSEAADCHLEEEEK